MPTAEPIAPSLAPRCPRCKSERSAHSVTWKDGTRTRRCENCSRLFAGQPVQREPAATPRRRATP